MPSWRIVTNFDLDYGYVKSDNIEENPDKLKRWQFLVGNYRYLSMSLRRPIHIGAADDDGACGLGLVHAPHPRLALPRSGLGFVLACATFSPDSNDRLGFEAQLQCEPDGK